MKRRPLSRRQRVDLFDAHKGICVHCGLPIQIPKEKWHVAHVIALSLGGKDESTNMGPAHDHCNLEDGRKIVTPLAAKAVRIRAKHLGIRTRKSRAFPCGKDSPWRKKVSREVVRR